MCVYVPSRKPNFPVDWRLLVKERIANIGIPLDVFWVLTLLMIFLVLKTNLGSWVFANQSTVHTGGVSRLGEGRVCGFGCWR